MSSDYTKPLLRHVVDENADVLSEAYIGVAEMYLADSEAMTALWADGPQNVGFLDWGLLTVSTPMRDVSYFITAVVDPTTPHPLPALAKEAASIPSREPP